MKNEKDIVVAITSERELLSLYYEKQASKRVITHHIYASIDGQILEEVM